jgi:hypothetical protein
VKKQHQHCIPQAFRPLREPAFCAWLGQARPGDALTYHRGFLALDASISSNEFTDHQRRELNRVARRAWWAATQGLVDLVQRRHGRDDYSYIVVARARSDEASEALSTFLLKKVA